HSSEIKFPRFHKADNILPVSQNTLSTVQARSAIECALHCLSLNFTSFSFIEQQGSCEV
ncbi:killer cell lectin-like receptor subfamily F member 1, partial [Biomphalaria glabrata]